MATIAPLTSRIPAIGADDFPPCRYGKYTCDTDCPHPLVHREGDCRGPLVACEGFLYFCLRARKPDVCAEYSLQKYACTHGGGSCPYVYHEPEPNYPLGRVGEQKLHIFSAIIKYRHNSFSRSIFCVVAHTHPTQLTPVFREKVLNDVEGPRL